MRLQHCCAAPWLAARPGRPAPCPACPAAPAPCGSPPPRQPAVQAMLWVVARGQQTQSAAPSSLRPAAATAILNFATVDALQKATVKCVAQPSERVQEGLLWLVPELAAVWLRARSAGRGHCALRRLLPAVRRAPQCAVRRPPGH